MRLSHWLLIFLVVFFVCSVSLSSGRRRQRRKWSLAELRKRFREQRKRKAQTARTAAEAVAKAKTASTTIGTTTTTTTTPRPTTTTTTTTTTQRPTTRRRTTTTTTTPRPTTTTTTTTPRPTTWTTTTTPRPTTTTTARRTTTTTTTTAPRRRSSYRRTKPAPRSRDDEETPRRPRGFFMDAGKTRDVYRELLDGRNKLSESFRSGFMRDCGRHNPAPKCHAYFSGVLQARARMFYKFGISLEEFEEEMSQVLERCIDDLDGIEVPKKDDEMATIPERQNRWRLCVYNQTINSWFLGSVGEVKLPYLMVCPGTIQRCLTVFDDKLTSVLSYIYDNHMVSLADIHSRAALIVYKCSITMNPRLTMYPFRRCIDREVVALDSEVRELEPKKHTYG